MLKNVYGFVFLGSLTLSSMLAFASTDQSEVIEEDAVARMSYVAENASGKNIDSHEILAEKHKEEAASLQSNERSTQISILLLSLLGFIALSNRRNI